MNAGQIAERLWGHRSLGVGAAVAILGAVLGLLALTLGAVPTPWPDVWAALRGGGDDLTRQLVLEFRLPRVMVALLCGAMFAASGTVMQGVVRNPLASPDIVGVGAGAGLFATVYLLAAPGAPPALLPWAALLGAWAGFGLVLLLAAGGPGGRNPVRLALTGVAVSAALGAAQQLVLVRAGDGVGGALSFLAGTVYAADMERVLRVLPFALLLLPLSLLLTRSLDLQGLGGDVATGLGLRLARARLAALAVGVGLGGAAVSGAGVLGFVGLLAPHLTRRLVGGRHAALLPLSMLVGAVLVLGADLLGRVLLPPLEIPAGILTTLVGGPYFLYLLRRT